MAKTPIVLNIDEKDEALYKRLKKESIFSDKENKDLFIIAMAYGYRNKVKRSIDTKKSYVRVEYLKPNDYAFINSIVLEREPIEIIGSLDKVFQVAEEYAHAGIKLLADMIDSGPVGSFDKRFEKELFEVYADINKAD